MTCRSPRISVVLPLYNRRDTIVRAVDSVLAQDMEDFELIVVDDGSTDDGPARVAAIADPRVRVVRQPDRMGANAARNRGIREAMSPIVAFLDSDDAFRPEKLSTVVALFDRHPDLGTLVDSYEIVKPTSGRNAQPLINRRIADNEAFLKALFTSTVRNRRLRKATSGITVRRDVAFKAGLFDEEVQRRQDMEFLARLAKTAPCQTTDRLLWTKYEQPQSISFTGAGFIASTLLISRIHPEYAASPSSMAADVVIYLAESLSRRRFGQVAADIRDLVKEFGLPATLALLGEGAWAWYRDPRKITLPEESA